MSGLELTSVLAHLERQFARALPGGPCQALMAPRPRPGWDPGRIEIPPAARPAAVLILLYTREGRIFIPFTLRTDSVESHRRQISFPGGAVEPGESPEEAALREAVEEVSLDPSAVEIRGRLTPLHVPVSGFVVHPVVGSAADMPDLSPNPLEVDRILDIPLERLLDPATVVWRRQRRGASERLVPVFSIAGGEIWGATAMILAELLWLLGWTGPGEPPAS